jgi:hypothetical protein
MDPKQLEAILSSMTAQERAALMEDIYAHKQQEEELDEKTLMENVALVYDVFIKNTMEAVSHSLEWLPVTTPCADTPGFNYNYFLIGTHFSDED